MSPNKNKTKHIKCIVKSTKIPKIYFSQSVLTYTYKENPFLRKLGIRMGKPNFFVLFSFVSRLCFKSKILLYVLV